MAQNLSVEVHNLHKSYGKLEVLKGVSLKVPKGTVLALLGPNGAGKTTTVKVLATLLRPDAGDARVNGYDVVAEPQAVRAGIGLTGQFAAVDEYLTGRENIRLVGRLYHLDSGVVEQRTSKLLDQFDLVDAADRPARTYSGGMKRRLDLAMSLVAQPPVLFLDEPTTGLDPRSRLMLWGMIKDLTKGGTTVLLTTQYMEEADYLASQVVVIDHGVVIAEGTPAELKAAAGAATIEISFAESGDLETAAALLDEAVVDADAGRLAIPAARGVLDLEHVLATLRKKGLEPDTAGLRRPTLDEVFLALTGHKEGDHE